MIELLYVSLVGLSSTLAKYDYCYDAVMAAKYDVFKPDFTEYGLKSEPECNQQGFGIIGTKPAPKMRTAKNIRSSGKSQTKKPGKMAMKHTPSNGETLPTLRTIMASA